MMPPSVTTRTPREINLESTDNITSPLKLVITKEITGYTCQFIYGKTLKNPTIVIPIYKLKVHKNNKAIANYNLTRNSWYNRGRTEKNIFRTDKFQLSNRCFEPADAKVNLYTTVPLTYPTKTLNAYELRQKGSENLNAISHTKQMNTFVDGTSIDDARSYLSIATGVMIHV